MPSGFGHILFGRLPAIQTRGKYAGERVYIKPELFGIRELQEFVQHAKSYFDHVSRRYVCQLKEVQKEAGCSSEAAFRENTDKKLLEQWRAILLTIPSISNVEELYMSNATKYGLSEIDRQAKELEAAGEQKKVGAFHRQMLEQYGQDDISVRKGREIIFTREGLMSSPLACDMFSRMTKC